MEMLVKTLGLCSISQVVHAVENKSGHRKAMIRLKEELEEKSGGKERKGRR